MRFGIPFHAVPSLETDVVRFTYALDFEFMLKPAAKDENLKMFRWSLPIQIVAPLPPDPSHLNVPEDVYNGPCRMRALAIV